MEEFGNPFLETSKDLLVLDTKEIMQESFVEAIRNIEVQGKQQYVTFVVNKIHKNKLKLFRSPAPIRQSKDYSSSYRSHYKVTAISARLYIACQSRDGDIDQFFTHENQACPVVHHPYISML